MATLKTDKIDKALRKKGFEIEERDHHYYFYYHKKNSNKYKNKSWKRWNLGFFDRKNGKATMSWKRTIFEINTMYFRRRNI